MNILKETDLSSLLQSEYMQIRRWVQNGRCKTKLTTRHK